MRKTIHSEKITLINCDQDLLEIILQGDPALSEHLHIQVPAHWSVFGKKVFRYVLDKIKGNPGDASWYTYLPIDAQKNVLLGSCGYKGQPDEDGLVEIGYEVARPYRNQGYATEIAALLVENAFRDERVKRVQAHTLAEKNASVRVLEKCGFQFIEELMDHEDGLIWKWMKEKE